MPEYKVLNKEHYKDQIMKAAVEYCDMIDCSDEDFPQHLRFRTNKMGMGISIMIDAHRID